MCAALLALVAILGGAPQAQPADASLRAAISNLGSFNDTARLAAAKTVRLADPVTAARLLTDAALHHPDEYVRYKAFVLLTGVDEPAAASVASQVLGDRNDRVRTVAYQWFEHHPRPDVVPRLLAALGTEQSEFVRPALTRALAAVADRPDVEAALVPLVLRGDDLFRGTTIEALGAYRRRAALPDIMQVARLDGPLQDDAITALGRIGDPAARATLAELQRTAPRDLQPTISAALCLLQIDCDARMAYLKTTLQFAASTPGYQPLLRGVVHALSTLAIAGRTEALGDLFDAGTGSGDAVRAPIALGIGTVALRNEDVFVQAIGMRTDPRPAIDLLRDAFDELSEDFEEERFGVLLRRTRAAAGDGSAQQRLADEISAELEY